MRNVTMQGAIEALVDATMNKVPAEAQELTREVTREMCRKLANMASAGTEIDDVTLAKLLVRAGYTLGALHFANIDLLIRQDMAKEAAVVG